jgi:hypothetical protein
LRARQLAIRAHIARNPALGSRSNLVSLSNTITGRSVML